MINFTISTIFNQLTAMPKRLAMVLTILFTLGVGTMLGQTFTRISAASDLSDGDEIIFVNQDGTYACGTTQNNNNRTPVAITTSSNSYSYKSSDNVQVFIVKVNGSNYGFHNGSGYIYSASSSNNYLRTNTTASTTAPSGTAAWTLSVSNNVFTVKNASNTNYYLAFNGTSYFSQYKSGQSKPYIYKKVTSTYEIIATSNNNNYGTVSVSGTTITASPKAGYTYANPAYEVTSGTATVTQDGNTFTVTPSSDCSIQINFAEKVKNTYIDNVQGNSTQTLYDTHSAPSLADKEPATTGTCEQQHWHFMGWVTEANKENPTDANIVKVNTSVTANGTTYYAVWAKGTTTGGGSTSKQYSFDITPSNFNSTSYAANNNEKTSTAKASDGSTFSVKWTSYQVMLQSSAMQWQKSTGYIYNSTDLGTINSVTVANSAGTFTTYYGTSKQPSSSTTVGNGYFQIKVGSSATGKTSKVTITFTKTTQGAQTTTYSDYITTCTTETTITLNPNGGTGNVITETTEETTYKVPTCSFSRTGYDFVKWNTKADGTGTDYNPNATINLNGTAVNLYAIWTPIKYTITYNLDGGTNHASNPANYTIETATISLQNPSKTGHNFGGWYKESTFATQVTQIAKGSTGDITLYAKWEVSKTATSLQWSAATCTATIDVDNTFPELIKSPDDLSPIAYSSSNTGVATIDANGDITLVAAGKTTITATFTETATHTGATASYTLTVNPSNCRWVETDIANIDSGDEVVVTMTNALGTTFALPNESKTSEVPGVILLTVDNGCITADPSYIWIIKKDGNNLTFESYANAGDFLTCNNADDGVRVNTGANKTFVVDDTYGYLKNTLTTKPRYLGVHNENLSWYSYALTNTGNFPAKIVGQTLKFYKRECLDASKVWVEGNLTNVTCSPQLPQQLAKDGSIELTFAAADGYALPNDVTVTNATKTWNKATGTLTISNPTGNVMVTVSAVELHTITWMVGSSSVLSEDVANGTGVTQTPASNPEGDAIGDCADTFLGWSEKSAGSTPQDAAYYDDLCSAAQMKSKHTSVTGDKTFYAVFATATTTPGTSTTTNKTYTHTITSKTWDANGAKTLSNISWTLSNNGDYYGYDGTKGQQVGSGSKPAKSMTLTTSGFASASKITSVTINTSGASDTNAKVSVKVGGTSYSCNANTTPAISTTATDYKFTGNNTGEIVISWSQTSSKAIYFKSITVEYSNTTTTPDVTTYSNYVTNCCAIAPATNLTVSGTTSNTATLTWTAPSPTTGITKLQVRNADNDAVVVDDVAVGTTTATITGLTECTKYNYYVASVGECEVFSNTVTAQPFSNAKTVNYDYNGGSGSPASFTTSCENQVITLPTATRAGYDFNGWYTAATGGTKVGDAGGTYNPTTSSITLYAQWTKKIYIISFHANGGEGTMQN